MKILVAIFAHNEEQTVADVIHSIPRAISDVQSLEIVVIDDGSTDQTALRAREAGAEVISLQTQRGLPRVFMTAVETAITRGADILVHTDGDNQFNQGDIHYLVEPIIHGHADAVIGNRNVKRLAFMPATNKWGNMVGSMVLNALLGLPNVDVSCGFRAYSRECFSRLFIFSHHTYTHETLIQLAAQQFRIQSVPIICKPRAAGESKLINNIAAHISRSLITIVRAILYYSPLRFFTWLAGIFFAIGLLLTVRYLIIFSTTGAYGHLQSLLLASVCLTVSFLLFIVGLHADLINRNTRINLEMLYLMRQEHNNKDTDRPSTETT